jgi:hypothetical protein
MRTSPHPHFVPLAEVTVVGSLTEKRPSPAAPPAPFASPQECQLSPAAEIAAHKCLSPAYAKSTFLAQKSATAVEPSCSLA